MKIFSNTKISRLLPLIAIVVLAITSCKKIEPVEIVEGEAKINVVNAVSGSNPQDVYQNVTKLSKSAISYGETTGYLITKAGINSTIALKNKDTETITASAFASLELNASYTLFYYSNLAGDGKMNGLMDDNTAPASGKARVRFVNFGTALNNNINISLASGTAIINGLAYEYSSSYREIDAGTSLNITVIGGETKIIPGTEFQSGKIYTVWFDAANSTMANYHIIAQN